MAMPPEGATVDEARPLAGSAADPAAHGLHRRFLWTRPEVALWDARWDRAVHPATRAGSPRLPAFVLMREGAYLKTVGRARAIGSPTQVTLYDSDREFVVSHPSGEHTAGTTFIVDPGFLAVLWSDIRGGRLDDPRRPFDRLGAPLSSRTHLLYRVLVRYLETEPTPDPLLVDDAVFGLVRRVVRDLPGEPPRRSLAPSRIRARVAELQVYLAEHSARRVTLAELGALVDCSPEYVSRVFAQEAGMPLSRYVARLRVTRAVDRILQGATSLTDVALDSGFASHSHFTARFTREFGMAPSLVREGSAAERVRRVLGE